MLPLKIKLLKPWTVSKGKVKAKSLSNKASAAKRSCHAMVEEVLDEDMPQTLWSQGLALRIGPENSSVSQKKVSLLLYDLVLL
jgi:hypothetical protein